MRRWMLGAALLGALSLVAPAALADNSALLATAPAEQVGMSKQKLERITTVFKQEIDQGKLPGVVVMVTRKGKLVYSNAIGFQDTGSGTPMKSDSLFRIYSMTKPFVAAGAMMLVEEGKIQLTDPVSKFLPAFKGQQVSVARPDGEFAKITYTAVPADRENTIQDLFRHTAGLAYGEITVNAPVKEAYTKAGLYNKERDYDARALSPPEFVERIAKAPLVHQPGTVWEYSLAIDVLGRVIEAASGKRLAVYLDDRLFKPLGMSDTGFWISSDKMPRLAQALPIDPASGQPNKLIDVSSPPGNDSGGAGAISTSADYLRFAQMLANGGQLDGVRVLSRTSVQLMTSDHLGARIADSRRVVARHSPSRAMNSRRLITEPSSPTANLNHYSREMRATEWGRWSGLHSSNPAAACRLGGRSAREGSRQGSRWSDSSTAERPMPQPVIWPHSARA
jgi:CubicO group peptidase (beta-lactamase class C family)